MAFGHFLLTEIYVGGHADSGRMQAVCVEEVYLRCCQGLAGEFVTAAHLPIVGSLGDERDGELGEKEGQDALPADQDEADN